MSQSIATRIGIGVLAAGLLSVGSLFGGIAYMASQQDKQALTSETKMIEGGLTATVSALTTLNKDYAWWPEFYTMALKRDVEWMKPNFGMGVYANGTFDIGMVLDDTGQPIAAWDVDTGETPDLSIADAALLARFSEVLKQQPDGKILSQSIFTKVRGKPALVAFNRLYPNDDEDRLVKGKYPVLVMGNYLTAERIAALGSTYLIGDLKLVPENLANSIAVPENQDQALGYLTWAPATPGTTTLKKSVFPLSALALASALIALFFGNMARRNAAKLVEAESSAKAETARAQEQLLNSAKMAQLGALTATVAHEIRNPLGAIRTSLFLLSRKLQNKGTGVEPQIQRIESGVERCDNIITQLLDFTRSQEFSCTSANLDDWLAQTIEEHAEQVPEEVSITCKLGIGGIEIPLDAQRLQRVIVNLINNAAEALTEATHENPDTPAKSMQIAVESRITSRGAEISVSDNGPGIPPDILARIMEPLFTTKSFGTGLGLPASANVMERHGGGLECRSTVGEGTCFTLWLPLAATAAKLPAQVAA